MNTLTMGILSGMTAFTIYAPAFTAHAEEFNTKECPLEHVEHLQESTAELKEIVDALQALS